MNDKGKAVCGRRRARGNLEAEIVCERSDGRLCAVPGADTLNGTAVSEAETCAVESGAAIEDHAAANEAIAEVNGAGASRCDRVSSSGDVACEKSACRCDCFDGGACADGDWRRIEKCGTAGA